MNTYTATIEHKNGEREALEVTASDYTKAYLNICYLIPKTSIIINLKEI
jgi:hypothetical protein